MISKRVLVGLGSAFALAAGTAGAQPFQPSRAKVEIAPFAGFQFGGGFLAASGREVSLDAGLDYGGTIDFRVADTWCVEGLYSRHSTELGGDGSPFGVTVERMMGGIMEEQGDYRSRFFGVALFGATRLTPELPGFSSKTEFTIGIGLGVKQLFSEHLGLRAEARGFYVLTETGGGLFCSGGCLFTFSGSGLWQGDLSGGLIFAF